MRASRPSEPDAEPPVAPGNLLAGKYRVERVIAAGGMGVVVAARHEELDEHVAIKFLRREALENKETVQRFALEARAAVRIKSEHVARVLDIGSLGPGDGGAPYIVMEYLDGEDLAKRLDRVGRRPQAEALELFLQACEAIAEAHALGIVHRDLKPGNLFVTQRASGTPWVKVLDFGISKVDSRLSRGQAALTSATAVLGSPLYMAPEQMRSAREADVRSDIWSLGMILFETLAGTAPFDAPTVLEMCNKVAAAAPASLVELRPDLAPELEHAVLRCLEKDPARRYQNVAEMVEALAPFAPPRAQVSINRVQAMAGRAPVVAGGSSQPRFAPGAVTLDAAAMAAAMAAHDRPTFASWGRTLAKRGGVGSIAGVLGAATVGALALGAYLFTREAPGPAVSAEAPPPSVAAPLVAPASPAPAEPAAEVPAEAEAPADDATRAASEPIPSASARRLPVRGKRPLRRPAAGPSAAPAATDHLFDEPK